MYAILFYLWLGLHKLSETLAKPHKGKGGAWQLSVDIDCYRQLGQVEQRHLIHTWPRVIKKAWLDHVGEFLEFAL